jgi:uncharacterized membrane protein (DUF485 family)
LGKQRYLLYVAAQLLGAICGSALLRLSLPPSYLETPFVTAGSATAAHPIQVFLLEFTCTFVLVYVVFATVVDKAGAAKVTPPTHPHVFTLCFCTARDRWNILEQTFHQVEYLSKGVQEISVRDKTSRSVRDKTSRSHRTKKSERCPPYHRPCYDCWRVR